MIWPVQCEHPDFVSICCNSDLHVIFQFYQRWFYNYFQGTGRTWWLRFVRVLVKFHLNPVSWSCVAFLFLLKYLRNQTRNINCSVFTKFPLSAKLTIIKERRLVYIWLVFYKTMLIGTNYIPYHLNVISFVCLFVFVFNQVQIGRVLHVLSYCPFWSAAGNQRSFSLLEYSILAIHWLYEKHSFLKSWKIRQLWAY